MPISINSDRLWSSIEQLAAFTDPENPYTRRAFSTLYIQSRDWLTRQFADAGLQVEVDAGGNLVGRLPGSNPSLKPIATGSHSDTVPSGGRFDGIAGVMAGLEIARALSDSRTRLRHPFEVVDFLSEEPGYYGVSCIGSRAMVGKLIPEMLENLAPDNSTLMDGIERMGGKPDELGKPIRNDNSIAGFFELHIEQGPVLEAENIDIGIVTDIVGIRRVNLVVRGAADHSGTTPMDLRKDALVGAAQIVAYVSNYARAHSRGQTYLVGTIGKLNVIPNGSNVIPGEIAMTLEIRSNSDAALDAFSEEVISFSTKTCNEMELALSYDWVSRSDPRSCAPSIQTAIEQACRDRCTAYRYMASGAGHDAAYMSRLGPSGMVFIPCREGRSHCSEEWTSPSQLAVGTQILMDSILNFDASTDIQNP